MEVCVPFLMLPLLLCATGAKRHAVYWNSTNSRLVQGELSVELNIGDYLDIYCPHYSADAPLPDPPENLALYLVRAQHFHGCVETAEAIKRWECNQPYAPYAPARFSEKIQRFTPFSLGFEFLPGHHYYYMSLPAEDVPRLPCMKLRVTVCCDSVPPPTEAAVVEGTPAPRSAGRPACLPPLPLLLLVSLLRL